MLELVLKYLIFFIVGYAQDFIITFYYRAIAKEQAALSALLSSTITLVNIFILYEILSSVDQQVASVIIVYALGNGCGTFSVVHFFHGKRHKKKRRSMA